MYSILLVQPNFKQGGDDFDSYWLPYSIGCLWSYANQYDWVKNNFSVADIIFKRENPQSLVQRVSDVDLAFFSSYMWNWEWTKHVAQQLKQANPNIVIVAGGPQVTNKPDETSFFENHPYIDAISLNEGEQTFVEILKNIKEKKPLKKIYQGGRLDDLDIPSPYLTGVFDKIIADNPDVQWNGTLETNRGCPFACTFCDWGSLTYAKIKKFPMPKVIQELTWMSEHKIEYLTIADANFGVFTDRDLEVTERLVELQNKYGYPKVVDATWYKNSSDEILEIVKKFIGSGFNRGLTLSVQSMDMDVLTEIRRRNMEISDLKLIFDKCNTEGIPSYTELILGLPKETFNSWRRGLCEVIEAGQHNAIESWLAQMLENAELNQNNQRETHDISTVVVENYLKGHNEEDNIPEKVELVTGTKYMPRDKFIDSWLYAWMINNFHNYGWSQVITRFLRRYKNFTYLEMYDYLFECIKNDEGEVGMMFQEAKSNIAEYLETGKMSDELAGHTYMWHHQKYFHKNYDKITAFVKSVFTQQYTELGDKIYHNLLMFQEDFTTKEHVRYPYQVIYPYNFMNFINGVDELKDIETAYEISKSADITGDEYYARLYFKRRQGWGKSVISQLS